MRLGELKKLTPKDSPCRHGDTLATVDYTVGLPLSKLRTADVVDPISSLPGKQTIQRYDYSTRH